MSDGGCALWYNFFLSRLILLLLLFLKPILSHFYLSRKHEFQLPNYYYFFYIQSE